MGNPTAVCAPIPFMTCFDALKTAWLKQLPAEPGRPRVMGCSLLGAGCHCLPQQPWQPMVGAEGQS